MKYTTILKPFVAAAALLPGSKTSAKATGLRGPNDKGNHSNPAPAGFTKSFFQLPNARRLQACTPLSPNPLESIDEAYDSGLGNVQESEAREVIGDEIPSNTILFNTKTGTLAVGDRVTGAVYRNCDLRNNDVTLTADSFLENLDLTDSIFCNTNILISRGAKFEGNLAQQLFNIAEAACEGANIQTGAFLHDEVQQNGEPIIIDQDGDNIVLRQSYRTYQVSDNNGETKYLTVTLGELCSNQEETSPTAAPTPRLTTNTPTTNRPTFFPSTATPTGAPHLPPSNAPSPAPTYVPSVNPSTKATTLVPSHSPTGAPTYLPSYSPQGTPTVVPTFKPSGEPNFNPSNPPAGVITFNPSGQPSVLPSLTTSANPTSLQDTSDPTQAPTKDATPFGNDLEAVESFCQDIGDGVFIPEVITGRFPCSDTKFGTESCSIVASEDDIDPESKILGSIAKYYTTIGDAQILNVTAPCSDINAENNTLIAPFQNLGNQIVSAGFLAAEGARIQGNAAQALVDIAAEKCIGTRRTLFVFHTDESGPAFYIGDDGSKVFYVPEENLIGEVTGVNSQGVEERQYISHVDADCIGEQPTDTISPGLIAGASAISTAAIGLAILGLYIMLARETTAERNEHLEDSREGVEGADEPEYKSKSEDLNNFLDTLDFKTNLDFISTDGFIKPLEELIKTVDFESQHFTYDKTKAARIIKAHGLNEAINDRRFGLFLASVAFPLFGASAGLLLATSPATRAAAFLAPTIAPVAAGIVYTSKFGEKFREANQDIAAFPKPSRKDEHSPQTEAEKALGELEPYSRLKMGKIDEAEATRHSLPVSLSTSDMRRDSQHLGNAFQYYKLVRSSLAKGDISVKQDKNGHFTSTWHTEYIKPFIQQESLNPTKIVYPTVVTGTQLKTLDPVDRPIVLEDTAKKSGEQPTTTDTPTPPVTREPITASLKHHSWITQLFRLEGVPPYRGIQMDHDNTLRFKEDIDIGVEHSDAIPRGTSAFLAVREKHQDFPVSDTARIDSLKKAAVFDRIHFQLQLLNYIEATRFSEGAEETKAEENPLFEAAYQFIDIESLTELRKIRKRVLDCREQLLLAWDLRPPEKPARKPFTLDTARNNFSLKQAERHTPSNIFGRFRSAVTNRELTTPLLSSVHDDADKDDTDGLADIPEEEQVELGRAGDTAANPIDRMLNALKNASDGVNFQMDSNQERELRNHLIKGNYVEALAHIDGLILQRDRTPLGVVTVRREISGMLS